MPNRESSDEIARLASRLMQSPFIDDATCDELVHVVAAANNRAEVHTAIRTLLEPLARQVRRIAASVVSQADGPE